MLRKNRQPSKSVTGWDHTVDCIADYFVEYVIE
jgi:hypothetical protein